MVATRVDVSPSTETNHGGSFTLRHVTATVVQVRRYGKVVRTLGKHGYHAYVPHPLPRTLDLSPDVVVRLSAADLAVGRLGGAGRLLPNPHLLIRPFSHREALDSSRIEGTQASLAEVFASEASPERPKEDVLEVRNYLSALEHGLRRLAAGFPLSIRLVREMHSVLLTGVRGEALSPGDFRTTQNWIGPPGTTLANAVFVPPPPDALADLLRDWEGYPHEDVALPALVKCALLHHQFETIHPFLDGNGRLGRLFVTLYLIHEGLLHQPLLYLSSYFERRRAAYYERLQAVRDVDAMEDWLCFFLEAVATQATDAVERAERLTDLREQYRAALTGTRSRAAEVVDLVLGSPVVSAPQVAQALGVTGPGAHKLLRQLADAGIIRQLDTTVGRRVRWYAPAVLDVVSA